MIWWEAVMAERGDETPDTARRLLEAAGPIFAEKGLRASGVREICAAAGANVSAVSFYFRSKEALYVEAVRMAYRSAIDEMPLPTWADDVPAERRLRDFVRVMLRRLIDHPGPAWHS